MNPNTWATLSSIIRALLTAFSAFVIGHKIFGTDITEALWPSIAAGVMTIASLLWGIFDKTATIEMWQSGIRTAMTFGGGLAIAKGVLTTDQLAAVIASVATILPLVYSLTSTTKTTQLASGEIKVSDLKQATPLAPKQ